MNTWQQVSSLAVKCRPSNKTLEPERKTKFLVAGLMASQEFQKCQFLVHKLLENYPDKYEEPEVRPMMNVEWNTYLLKMRRRHGGATWKTSSPVLVFINGEYFGDDVTLVNFTSQTYSFSFNENFEFMGEVQLANHFDSMIKLGRCFVTLMIAARTTFVGSLLIMLYADLVPRTCKFFMDRCKNLHGSWDKAVVIRVVPDSWIQFRGIDVPPYPLPCENYTIPHDRRGIVSMCNYTKHSQNTQQFNITLNTAPWMDHKYVAFGIVVQGDETLIKLEKLKVAADYSPMTSIYIDCASEFVVKEMELTDPYLLKRTSEHMDLTIDNVDSQILEERYLLGKYCMITDLDDPMAFLHLPDYLLAYLKKQKVDVEEQPEVSLSSTESTASISLVDVDKCRHFNVHSVISLENKALCD